MKIESTEPEFIKLERALIRAFNEIGWKNMTAFIVKWAMKNQPKDDAYSLEYWMKHYKK